MEERKQKSLIRRMAGFVRGIKAEGTSGAGGSVDEKSASALRRPIADIDFGVRVDNKSALKITAYYAGIRIISENVASLPVRILHRGDKGWMPDNKHPLNRIFARPNRYTNWFSFVQTMVTWLKDWGNAYAVIERQAGIPVALHQAHPAGVQITRADGGAKYYQVAFADSSLSNLNGMYSDEDIIHVMEVSIDGVKGLNPVYLNAGTLEKSMAQERFAADFYRKGGNIRAVMETDGSLGDDAYKAFMDHMALASQNFDTPLLEYGIKYKSLDVNPVAAQLLQSETMSLQDVCRILGLPPHMIAELSKATFSNIEHQTIQFVQYTLRPLVKRFEVELENKLLFDSERPYYGVDFSLEGLLRGDTAARSAYYHNAILDGYMSRNEVRELEGYGKVEGLDDMLYPLNTGTVGKDNNNDKSE